MLLFIYSYYDSIALSLSSNPILRNILPPSLVHAGDDDNVTIDYYNTTINNITNNNNITTINGTNQRNNNPIGSPSRFSSNTFSNPTSRSLSPPGSPAARHEKAREYTYLHQHYNYIPFSELSLQNNQKYHDQHNHQDNDTLSINNSFYNNNNPSSSSSSSSIPILNRPLTNWDP